MIAKRLTRTSTICVLLVTALLSAPWTARAGGSAKETLAAIPADAMGFFCIPNLKSFDANYQKAIAAMGLQPLVPPPAQSLLTLIKMSFPFAETMNEDQPIAFVIMPATNPFELPMKMAFIMSSKDPKALLEKMGATQGEEGVWSVNMFGQPAFATIKESQLIVARMPDVAKAIAASKTALSSKLAATEVKTLEGLDALLWIGADRLIPMIRPQVEGFMSMMAMQGGGSPLAMKQAELNKKQLGLLFDGISSLSVGLSLDGTGIGLRFATTCKPGTELHKRLMVRNTDEPLLRGLPDGDYMIAVGSTTHPAQLKAEIDSLDDYVSLAQEVEGLDKDQINKLKGILSDWIPLSTGVRAVLQAVAPNGDGVFKATVIFSTPDSAVWMKYANNAFDMIKTIVKDQKVAELGEDALAVADATTFTKDAEKIGDAQVAHVQIDLSKIKSLDDETREQIQSVIGKDGPMVRLAAADQKTVVLTFGGGTAHFQKCLTQAKSGDSPLDAESGIQKTSKRLPKSRYMVGYLALDHVVDGIKHVMNAIDEEPPPIQLPKLNAPLAMSGTGGEGWAQVDIAVPLEVISAVKDAAMAFMGTQGQMQPPPPPSEGDEDADN